MAESPKILYCRCAYAKVVPEDVKDDVLKGLCASGASFDTVSDLCEMSARKDPQIQQLLAGGPAKIAACYPRAVKWLFHNAGVKFPEDEAEAKVLNMRTQTADEILSELLDE
ncbi:MAG: hypothetical protein ACI8UO_001146 [Verrucomicrobiales bacterium]|jgi:hypothetical protein